MKLNLAKKLNGLIKRTIRSIKLGFYDLFYRCTGKRIVRPCDIRPALDKLNFQDFASDAKITVFDVGANIGQSSLAFRREFPQSDIHAFEPFEQIFDQLKISTREANVSCVKLGISNREGQVEVPRVLNPFSQTSQIFPKTLDSGTGTEILTLSTLDRFCAEQKITKLDILKTDTEGHDLEVLQGAEGLLRSGVISHIICEGTLRTEDQQHTSLLAIIAHLQPFGYELFSVYEWVYGKTGRLEYFNAHFRKKALMPDSRGNLRCVTQAKASA